MELSSLGHEATITSDFALSPIKNIASPVKAPKSKPKPELRVLINNMMFKSRSNKEKKQTPKETVETQASMDLFRVRSKDRFYTPKCGGRKQSPLPSMNTPPPVNRTLSKQDNKPSLREKRLHDARIYKNLCVRDNSDSGEKSSTTNIGSVTTIKRSQARRLASPEYFPNRKEYSLMANEVHSIVLNGEDLSEGFSMEIRDPDSINHLKNGSFNTSHNQSGDSKQRYRDDSAEKEEWKSYYSRAADPLYGSRIGSTKRPSVRGKNSDSAESHQNSRDDFLEKMKPSYNHFIKKNFDGSMVGRLKTFGTFAFTSVERDNNKEAQFLNDAKQGSMAVVDLWSSQLVSELTKRAQFSDEKKKIEKFAFYKANTAKGPKSEKPQFTILHRKNENIYKDLIARKELAQFKKRTEGLEFQSSMQRHLPLQGKSVYKIKENPSQITKGESGLKEIKGELASIFNELNQFAEKNQSDYVNKARKLLESKDGSKKNEKEKRDLRVLIKHFKQQKREVG